MPQDWEVLRQRVHDFAIERDWEQFHTPKKLSPRAWCTTASVCVS